MIDIIEVSSKKKLKKFIDFPHTLYKGDPNYVPELYISQKDIFNTKKYPFFRHASAEFFLAQKNNKIAGRIVVFRNYNYNEFTGENIGFFGFFESINDYQVAESLFNKASEWIKKEGLDSLIGPENYTVHDSCGILIEGFDIPPVVAMPYNKEYYPEFFNRYGFTKKIDMLSYQFKCDKTPEKLIRHRNIAASRIKKLGIKIRAVDMRDYDSEIIKFHKVYNAAFEKNWGFVPLTFEEFSHQAENLKLIADTEMILFAEKNEEFVGFVVTLPDINQALIKIRKGRLFPFGLFQFLYSKKKINGCRISITGIIEKYRKLGIDAILYARGFELARKKKIDFAEASYVMEDNIVMNNNMKSIGGRIYKKYRIYELVSK